MEQDLLFFMERRVIFETALKLIRAGKFQTTSMTEIAHLAGIDENVTLYFFESREKLIQDLAGYITASISKIIKGAAKDELSFQNRFFKAWSALYEYYVQHPGVVAFVEQASSLTAAARQRINERDLMSAIEDLFRSASENLIVPIRSETLAFVFHSNVVTAVKLHHDHALTYHDSELKSIAQILWDGIAITSFAERTN
jgi:AcrR family transcriptional regulator